MVFFFHKRHWTLKFMHYCESLCTLYEGIGTDGRNDTSSIGPEKPKAKSITERSNKQMIGPNTTQ